MESDLTMKKPDLEMRVNASVPSASRRSKLGPVSSVLIKAAVLSGFCAPAFAGNLDCTNWQTNHPEWIWCDDFESDSQLERDYFEVNRASGRFGVSSEHVFGGNGALRSRHIPGVPEAGAVRFGFGRSPVSSRVASSQDFQEVYWRFYMSTGPTWEGNAIKVTRATIFTRSDWTQAAIGHLWDDDADASPPKLGLGLDAATGVSGGTVVTSGYNDFANLRWIGKSNGTIQVYTPENRQKWFCVEVHMKLNTPGQSDGTFTFWVNDRQEAHRGSLNWRGSYTGYGINAVMLENYVNGGVPHDQTRYYDNLVVSRARIGCQADTPRPMPPTDVIAR